MLRASQRDQRGPSWDSAAGERAATVMLGQLKWPEPGVSGGREGNGKERQQAFSGLGKG